jgi:hypothetical protein
VSHNPYLCLRYNCHINVEACVNVNSIKYLYKYAYKGADRATATLHGVRTDANAMRLDEHINPIFRDEIKALLDALYISSS